MALFVGACVVHGQPFTIKFKESGDGDVALVKKSDTTVTKVLVEDAGGGVLADQNETKGDTLEFKETTIKRAAGKSPTKLMREYVKAQSVKGDTAEDWGLQGKTVLIEKKDKQFHFTYKDGSQVEGKAAAALAKEFGKKSDTSKEIEKMILPQKAVNVGESWKIQMAKIVTELSKEGMTLDATKATGKGTLVKAYKKNGRQFGEMRFSLDIPVATVGKGTATLTFAAGAKILMDLSLDACIDGSSDAGVMKMKMTMRGDATTKGAPGATVTLEVVANLSQTQTDLSKKR
jgi:hypothetical protein